MDDDKPSFVFFNVWYESCKVLCRSRSQLAEVMLALVEYAISGDEYSGSSPIARAVIIQAEPVLRSNAEKWRKRKSSVNANAKANGYAKSTKFAGEADLSLYEQDR